MLNEKQLTAAEVKALPVGTEVTLHGYDRRGNHVRRDCTIVQSGKTKKLRSFDWYRGETKIESIVDRPRKWYTVRE